MDSPQLNLDGVSEDAIIEENLPEVALTKLAHTQLELIRRNILESISRLPFSADQRGLMELSNNMAYFQGQLLIINGLLSSTKILDSTNPNS